MLVIDELCRVRGAVVRCCCVRSGVGRTGSGDLERRRGCYSSRERPLQKDLLHGVKVTCLDLEVAGQQQHERTVRAIRVERK